MCAHYFRRIASCINVEGVGEECDNVVFVELSHVTKLDDNLMPRAEALQDFTARDSQQLSFKVRDCLCRCRLLYIQACCVTSLIHYVAIRSPIDGEWGV